MQTFAERLDTTSGDMTRFEPTRVVLQDHGHWCGARFEVWESEPQELAESVLFQHGVVVNDEPVESEVYWAGRRATRGRFAPGPVAILPAGMPYRARGRSNTQMLVLGLAPELLRSIVQSSARRDVELVPSYGARDDFIRSACEALAADVRGGYALGPLYGESIVAALAAHLVRDHSADPRLCAEPPTESVLKRERIRQFVLDRLHEPLTLAEMAAVVQLDVFAFARWFRKSFGVSAYQFVVRARVERAKTLLAVSPEGIVGVALQCGFGSHSHLATTFKRLVGVSPSTYRALRRRGGAGEIRH